MTEAPQLELDTEGKYRFAKITYQGKTVSERVPLHLFKQPPTWQENYLASLVKDLQNRFYRQFGIDLAKVNKELAKAAAPVEAT